MRVRINGLIQDIYGLFRSCFPGISGVPPFVRPSRQGAPAFVGPGGAEAVVPVSALLPGRFLQK